jgi:CO/xanthine dehydrogenase Mo-binding subunit
MRMSFVLSRTLAASEGEGFGKPVRRVESARLVAGRGAFSDDVNLPGQVHAAFVRSPHAHARIVRIDGARALRIPGVILVLSGAADRWRGLTVGEFEQFQLRAMSAVPGRCHQITRRVPDRVPTCCGST